MKQGRIIVAGIGPGDESMVTPQVRQAVNQADDVVGYSHYISLVKEWMPEGVETHSTGMTHERARAEKAFDLAVQGRNVVVVSSGDAGIYGMAPLVLELYARGISRVSSLSSCPGSVHSRLRHPGSELP
nr:SAM-dependent methyltransferase [Prosthecochloris sp. HL-130-GSB]